MGRRDSEITPKKTAISNSVAYKQFLLAFQRPCQNSLSKIFLFFGLTTSESQLESIRANRLSVPRNRLSLDRASVTAPPGCVPCGIVTLICPVNVGTRVFPSKRCEGKGNRHLRNNIQSFTFEIRMGFNGDCHQQRARYLTAQRSTSLPLEAQRFARL